MENQTLQEEISELVAIANMIENPLFQKYIAKPMSQYKRDRVRKTEAFFSESIAEAHRKGGQVEGIELFTKLIENIHTDLKNKLHELEDSPRG